MNFQVGPANIAHRWKAWMYALQQMWATAVYKRDFNCCSQDEGLAMSAIVRASEAYSLTTLAHFVSVSYLLLIKYSPCGESPLV